jgi:hypothetical protein
MIFWLVKFMVSLSKISKSGLSTDCPDFSVPLDTTSFTVAMAADDEQLNAVPLDCLVQLEVNIFYLYDDI